VTLGQVRGDNKSKCRFHCGSPGIGKWCVPRPNRAFDLPQKWCHWHEMARPLSGRSETAQAARQYSPLFELALVLVRFDQIAGVIVNANHSIM
jgi:hypothetical protein